MSFFFLCRYKGHRIYRPERKSFIIFIKRSGPWTRYDHV